MRTRFLFALWSLALFAMTHSAWAQCPPTAPTFVLPGPGATFSVDEGGTTSIPVMGGGPVYEWDTDCDGITPAFGDHIGPSPFVFTAQDRDGPGGARLCVRSVNPTCPMGSRFSAIAPTQVNIRNVAPTITTNLLPVGAVGRMYSFALAASDPANPPGASATRDPFGWSAMGLPTGLTINAMTGVISGTPLVMGTFTVTVSVNDGDGGTNSRTYTLVIAGTASSTFCPMPVIMATGGAVTPVVDEGGTVNVSARVPDIGGCSCRVAWDFACDGSIDVVDTTVSVSAVGRDGPNVIRPCAIAIPVPSTSSPAACGVSSVTPGVVTVNNVAPTITTASMPNGTVGTAYVAQVLSTDPANPPTAGGIQDPQTWAAVGLPPGLVIDPLTGIVFGTPTMNGTFTVTFTVSDGDGGVTVRMLPIVIGAAMAGTCPVPVLTGGVVPVVDEGGSTTLSATLGASPCGCAIEWDVDCDGSANGTGSTFSLSGVDRDGPSAVRVCLRGIPGALSMCSMPSAQLPVSVNVLNVAPTITTTSLPNGTIDMMYAATVNATDPANPPVASMTRDPIAWTAVGLPPGLAINMMTGLISGRPTTAGGAMARCYDVIVSANDGDGGITSRTMQLCLTTTASMLCPTAGATIREWIAPEGGSNMFSVAFTGTGACGCTIEWDVGCDGTNDATGLTLTYSARGLDGPTSQNVCWISRPSAMGPCNASSSSASNVVRITNVAPTITTTMLPDATAGAAYTATVSATDPANPPVAMSVQDPFSWSLTGAPSWLSINAMTGVLSGTPPASAAGMSFTFTVVVEDGDGGRTTVMLTIRVVGGGSDAGVDSGVDSGVGVDSGADSGVVVDGSMPDTMVPTDSATDSGVPGDSSSTEDSGSIEDAMVADATIADATGGDSAVDPDASSMDGASSGDAARSDAGTGGDARMPPGGVSGDGTCACRAAGHSSGRSNAPLALGLSLALATLASRRRSKRAAR